MPTTKLNKRTVDSAFAEESAVFYWDSELKGFGLKVTPAGAKSYVLQYRTGGREAPTRRYTIGKHGSPWTPEQARRRALDLLTEVRGGRDPVKVEKDRRSAEVELAFDAYIAVFIKRYARSEQTRSWRQAEAVLKNHASPVFGSKPIDTISRREIARLIESVTDHSQSTARYLHAVLRKLFRWAVARGDLSASPMAEMIAPRPVPARERVMSDPEIAALWRATTDLGWPFGTMFRMLLITGQRREEVAAMRWSEINLAAKAWTIPASRAKNGSSHLVPLPLRALAELRAIQRGSSDFVFSCNQTTAPSGWSKAKKRLDGILEEAIPDLPTWRTHDLRRTVATGLQRLDVRFEVIEAILNHVSGSRAGVAGVYQRHDWADEKRAALSLWAQAIKRPIRGGTLTKARPRGGKPPLRVTG